MKIFHACCLFVLSTICSLLYASDPGYNLRSEIQLEPLDSTRYTYPTDSTYKYVKNITLDWDRQSDVKYYKILKWIEGSEMPEYVAAHQIKIFYLNQYWNTAYVHYGVYDTKNNVWTWTIPPGEKMEMTQSGFAYTFEDTPYLAITLNDGENNWDNNNQKNYLVKDFGVFSNTGEYGSPLNPQTTDIISEKIYTTTYIDENIEPGTKYEYQIQGFSEKGEQISESDKLIVNSPPKEKHSIYPYLTWDVSNNHDTSIVINYETKDSQEGIVYFGLDQGNLTHIVKGEKTTYHHLKLNYLQADTKYFYRVGNENSEVFWFRTAKAQPDKTCFLMLSDMQDGLDYHTPPRRWEEVAKEMGAIVQTERVDFMVAPGDLVSNVSYDNWKIFLDKGKSLLPYVVIMPAIGNHDTYADCFVGDENFSNYYGNREFNSHFNLPGDNSKDDYYYFSYGNCYFVVLNTEIFSIIGDNAGLTDNYTQIEWLINRLKDAKKYDWVFVYHHIPPYSVQPRNSDKCLRLRPITKHFDTIVDWDISGHVHSYQRFNPLSYDSIVRGKYGNLQNEGVGYMTLGPAGNAPVGHPGGSSLLAFPTDKNKNGLDVTFSKVNIDKKKISISTYSLGDIVNPEGLHVIDSLSYEK